MKLPAYGRALLAQRERGEHPPLVWVIYGSDWRRGSWARLPRLCVGEDYSPGTYDWSVLSGIPAGIVWRQGEKVHELAAEVARATAPVMVHFMGTGEWPYAIGRAVHHDVCTFLYGAREYPELAALWSVDDERDYLARERAWEEALLLDLKNNTNSSAHGRPNAAAV